MIDVIRFKAGHLDFIKPKAIYDADKGLMERIAKLEGGMSHTLVVDGKIIAIVGLLESWPGLLDAWAVTTDEVKKYPIGLTKTCLSILHFYEETRNANRVQMTVLADYPDGIKFAATLGFVSEGTMRKYGPDGADYVLMARVKP